MSPSEKDFIPELFYSKTNLITKTACFHVDFISSLSEIRLSEKNGEYSMYLRITHNRIHRYISTGVSILEKHWNEEKETVRMSHRNSSLLNACGEKFKAAKKLAAVAESLLPFINGPLRLTSDNMVRTAHFLNAKRYDKRSPQIFKLPQSANSFEAEVVPILKLFLNLMRQVIDEERSIILNLQSFL